jgi:LmbE family N-acetylglucosaminyl deacetylase
MIGFAEALEAIATSLTVVAPHPDDDVLGCGALITRVARQMPVHVVYVTDGAASHTGSRRYPPERLRAVREREAARALRRLGVGTAPRFLRWPDGTVPSAGDSDAGPLLAAFDECFPHTPGAAIAIPWRRDPHCDHRATASLARAVLMHRPRALCVEYAVWLGVIGEPADEPLAGEGLAFEVDSRPWNSAKRAALREHRSQLGKLITDASTAFALPDDLLARALGPVERYVVPQDYVW